ncbi:MAG: ATP-binding protein [Candidatus Omnitrophica bacterium]|nr:ATP-binding protein [Candidatus Omnitrophota bacterium]
MLIKRELTSELMSMARQYPVVTITGPRQSGKTTLARKTFPKHRYVNLEEPDVRELAQADPRAFLAGSDSGIILDEIQRVPQLLSYIQAIVDVKKKKGRFILTGSRSFELMESVTQSLAGRTAILSLLPLSIAELKKARQVNTVDQYLIKGFYPRVYADTLDPFKTYRNYFQTYIERDLRALITVRDLSAFQKFVRLCAGRVGQIFNASALSSEVGVSVPTINAWVSILQESYIVCLLQPYSANIRKRLVRSPKIYFYDVGLAAYLLGVENVTQMSRDPLRGNLFENMVVMELMKCRINKGQDHGLFFFRDDKQHEVDVITASSGGIVAIEIKSSQTFHQDFLKSLKYVKKVFHFKPFQAAVIYAGSGTQAGGEFSLLNYEDVSSAF